jgi:hypothetical protein
MTTRPSFTTAEGLRLLLVRLHYSGPAAWRHDQEAAELVAYTMDKYRALARRHGLEPADAAVAAFDAMRTRAVRTADDPWAVITRAVQLTLIYEARAHGLLCSTYQARRAGVSANHDAERFSDRESNLLDYHPAFHVSAEQDEIGEEPPAAEDESTNAFEAADAAVALFVELGWPEATARGGIEYICARLIRTGSRLSAFESLRRDHNGRALLDLDQEAWLEVLRAVLGNQHPDRVHTAAGRGILLRLLIGHQIEELHADSTLADAITATAPEVTGSSHV